MLHALSLGQLDLPAPELHIGRLSLLFVLDVERKRIDVLAIVGSFRVESDLSISPMSKRHNSPVHAVAEALSRQLAREAIAQFRDRLAANGASSMWHPHGGYKFCATQTASLCA